MPEKLLTIIIPCYNSAGSLSVFLESIGSPVNTEIIVIDDKSTEQLGLYNELKTVYQGRVQFFSNDGAVKSAGAARNIGLKNAAGKWLFFADSDDVSCPVGIGMSAGILIRNMTLFTSLRKYWTPKQIRYQNGIEYVRNCVKITDGGRNMQSGISVLCLRCPGRN